MTQVVTYSPLSRNDTNLDIYPGREEPIEPFREARRLNERNGEKARARGVSQRDRKADQRSVDARDGHLDLANEPMLPGLDEDFTQHG